jgi:hypothetical protein
MPIGWNPFNGSEKEMTSFAFSVGTAEASCSAGRGASVVDRVVSEPIEEALLAAAVPPATNVTSEAASRRTIVLQAIGILLYPTMTLMMLPPARTRQ